MSINTSLAVMLVGIYNQKKREGECYIPFTAVSKRVMLQLYDSFVKDGSIQRIEDLTQEEKKEIIDECRSDGGDYTKKTLTQKSKVLYLIKQINQHS